MRKIALLFVCLCTLVRAQTPIGTLEGQIVDPAGALVSNAEVSVRNSQTGLTRTVHSSHQGTYHFSDLPIGLYLLEVKDQGFAPYSASSIRLDIGQVVSWPVQLQIASEHSVVNVSGEAVAVDTSQTIGNVVSEKQVVDLPLNGRDLTQLGLLQPGVAPMTAGLAEAGGIARSGQAYAVNGQRPESNNYLLDGASNVDSVNGGYALRTPVDAVSEFRILSLNAPAEYGETSGATTSVVTKSGGNAFHGDLYEFLRNDAMDSRNFFAAQTEPLHRNQYGATLGGPIRKDKDFFFVYYEGQRDSEGKTQAAIVPTAAERTGDFSGLTNPATGSRWRCRIRSLCRPRNCIRSPILAPTYLNPPSSDRRTTTRAASAWITTSARATNSFCDTPHRHCISSIRCPSPEPASPAFPLPTTYGRTPPPRHGST
jgi:Carboxypeptidase regulatory-like domain